MPLLDSFPDFRYVNFDNLFKMLFLSVLSLLLLSTSITAHPHSSSSSLSKRCVNSADDRTCWGDYDISTNYYEVSPDTGVVREYWFDITNTTASPDGIEHLIMAVNGTVPGPTIIADWGDTVGELTSCFTLSSREPSSPVHILT